MSHAEKGGGGGGGLFTGPLADAMDPLRPLEAMDKVGLDEAKTILGLTAGVIGWDSLIDKHLPDPFDFKKGGAKTEGKADSHGGGDHGGH